MTIKTYTANPFQTNGYVLHDTGEAALVDAPSHTEAEHRKVLDYLNAHDLTVRHLLLTHAHIDHIFGCAFFAERFEELRWRMHPADEFLIARSQQQAQAFGVPLEAPPAPDTSLSEGDVISLGEATLDVLHTPGHSPGSVSFVDHADEQVVSGDVLFEGSIGRTQGLPQTSMEQLLRSIISTLLPLGDGFAVHPGHGPSTTIGRERASNPFLQKRAMR